MKTIKLLATLLIVIGLSSCQKEEIDLPQTGYVNIINNGSENSLCTIKLDNDKSYEIKDSMILNMLVGEHQISAYCSEWNEELQRWNTLKIAAIVYVKENDTIICNLPPK